jgi:hypothetical protein
MHFLVKVRQKEGIKMNFKKAFLFKVIPAFNESSEVQECLKQYELAEKRGVLAGRDDLSEISWRIFRASWQIKWFLEGQDWPEKIQYLPKLETDFQTWFQFRPDLLPEMEENLRNAFYRWKISEVLVEELGSDQALRSREEFGAALLSAQKK